MDAGIVIIGAGAAGLIAARELAQRSFPVVLIEARDRIGGRVLWHRFEDGAQAELGAEFIHGRALETLSILRETHSGPVEIEQAESWALDPASGELRRDDNFFDAAAVFEAAQSLDPDESVDRFLERCSGDGESIEKAKAARAFVEGFDAADPAIASARGIAQEWSSGADASSRPQSGYRLMFEHLLSECTNAGVRLLTSTAVKRIAWQRGGVRVEAAAGSAPLQFSARAAIVTLPISVLRAGDIVFDPPLPQRKHDALAKLEMGPAIKVVLNFRSPFWTRLEGGRYANAGFFRAEEEPFTAYWTQWPQTSTTISAWAGGPRAAALAGSSLDRLAAAAIAGLGRIFGDRELVEREFAGAAMHDWSADPFSQGAYSYVAVGGTYARAELAAPIEDTLFFAGEGTSTDGQGGTVNGALETGLRAAKEVRNG